MQTDKGQALIELIIGFGLITIVLGSVSILIFTARESRQRSADTLIAETINIFQSEALRSIRDEDWNNLVSGAYHLEEIGNKWSLVSGSNIVNDFTKEIEIGDICRNPSGVIVNCSSGTLDPSTKTITVKVSWSFFFGGNVEKIFHFSRYLDNTTWVQTTETEFNLGETQGTIVTNNAGGEVIINFSGCPGNWQNPQVCEEDNTPKQVGEDVFVQGDYAYMLGGGGTLFLIYDVSDPENVSLISTTSVLAKGFSLFVKDDFVYVAASHNNNELQIIDVSDKTSPQIVGTHNTPGREDGLGIFVSGSVAYMSAEAGGGADFFTFDVTDPTNPVPLDSLDLASSGNYVYTLGNYAYVATDHDSQELTIIDVTDPSNISITGSYDASGNEDGLGIFVRNNNAFLTTSNGADDLFIINISVPASPSLISSFDLEGSGFDVFVDGDYAFVGTDSSSKEFQVVDISTITSPFLFGSADLDDTVNGVFVKGFYAFIASRDNRAEFQVIKGGPGTGGDSSGTFISVSFDTGKSVGFNYLTWSATKPTGTDIIFQIATNNDNSTWSYVGPDGTSSTFYNLPGAIPLNIVEGRYIRYKATLSTDTQNVSPILESVVINYSP